MKRKHSQLQSQDNHKANSYYRSLTRKMVLTILLFSITPLIMISMSILYYFEASYKGKALDYLQLVVKKHCNEIDSFLDERLADIKLLGKSYSLEQLSNEKFLEHQLAMLHEAYAHSFVDLGLVTNEGVQIAYAGPYKLREANYSKALWFKQAIKKDYYISDVFKGLRGLPHFIVTVRQQSEGRTWILRATVDFEAFNSLVQRIQIGATGFAFIVNQQAELQTKPLYDMGPSSHLYTQFVKSSNSWGFNVRFVEKKNDLGVTTLYIMSRLKQGDWLLIYQQSARDAFLVLHRARTVAAIIFAAAVASIVFVTILIARNMVRRISEADLQREMMNEQVIEAGKLASIGELAAGIAHEINNPVAIMVEEAGWIEDLLHEEDMASCNNLPECVRAVNQIRKQGKRCKQITHKLLSFARKTDPVEKKVQLNEIIMEVVGLSQQRAKYDNITLTTKLASDLPEVTISPSEMQQVLLNLINNSLDALQPKGGNVEVSTHMDGDYVLIHVKDNGPGIPEANLSRIFDPFFTTKPVGKGTGLGLSICYGIVRKMNGEITVDSTIGSGTIFNIRLPKGEEPQDNQRAAMRCEDN